MEITPRAEEEGVRGPSSSSSFRHWPGHPTAGDEGGGGSENWPLGKKKSVRSI